MHPDQAGPVTVEIRAGVRSTGDRGPMSPSAGCQTSLCSLLKGLFHSAVGEGPNARLGLYLAVVKLQWEVPL